MLRPYSIIAWPTIILLSIAPCQPAESSWLLRNVSIVEGSDAPPYSGAVRVQGAYILAAGQLDPLPGERIVVGNGRVLAPGFIDAHPRADDQLPGQRDAEIRAAVADLVLFDPATAADRATPEQPEATAVGIISVWINGRPVYRCGATTGERPGRVLRRGVP